jgi:hypothetical protein
LPDIKVSALIKLRTREKGISMTMVLSIIFWVLMGWLTSYLAQQRGRDPLLWFLIGMAFGLIGLLILFLLPVSEEESQNKEEGALSPGEEERLATQNGKIIDTTAEPILFDDTTEWYYIDQEHQQHGPVYIDALKKAWNENKLDPHSYVWRDGIDTWKKLEEIPDLYAKVKN